MRDTPRQRETETEIERGRLSERHIETARHGQTDRQTARQTDRCCDRKRGREIERERERWRHREIHR